MTCLVQPSFHAGGWEELERIHRRRRRASERTSAAGVVCTFPARYSSSRRWISAFQAGSTSAGSSIRSSRLSIRRRARRARSFAGSPKASASIRLLKKAHLSASGGLDRSGARCVVRRAHHERDESRAWTHLRWVRRPSRSAWHPDLFEHPGHNRVFQHPAICRGDMLMARPPLTKRKKYNTEETLLGKIGWSSRTSGGWQRATGERLNGGGSGCRPERAKPDGAVVLDYSCGE